MTRRPPGPVASQRKYLLALAFILLPWLQLADAQQQHRNEHQLRSPPEDDHHAAPNLGATPLTGHQVIETPRIHERRKNTVTADVDNTSNNHKQPPSRYNAVINPDDVRAAHALAPDLSVRAPSPSTYRTDSAGVGGLSQQLARSLEDWEVEDFVLLATVDGDLYASDRKTGHERWHFKADHPMVETRHFRANRSVVDEDYDPIDHFIWVVEPARDGELYLWRPIENGLGLVKMPWTMKSLVDTLSPHYDEESGIVYTGDKKITMVTLNADTGTIIKEFGSSGTYINKVESESCFRPNALADGDSEECSNKGTITLGRTEYMVNIQRNTGVPIASLKYSEWGPNTRNNDLIQQNHLTKDNRYVTCQHDGQVYGFDYERFSGNYPVFTKKLDSPVARVFDVLHRGHGASPSGGQEGSGDPDLIALPQPPLPASDEDTLRVRSEKVFMNQTEAGSWYALSGSLYPLIVQAEQAQIYKEDFWNPLNSHSALDGDQLSKVLVGTHRLPDGGHRSVKPVKNRPFGAIDPPREVDHDGVDDRLTLPAPQDSNGVFDAAMRLPEAVASPVVDLVRNPVAIVLMILSLLWLSQDKLRGFGWKASNKTLLKQIEVSATKANSEVASEPSTAPVDAGDVADVLKGVPAPSPAIPIQQPDAGATVAESSSKGGSPAVSFAEPVDTADKVPSDGPEGAETPKAKKRSHRGRRGGVKHKKGGNKREPSQSHDDDPPVATVEEVVNKAKQLGGEPKLEPDIITVPNGIEELSGPILKMGQLEVDESQQLGIGSNGTVVFAGKWDGRDVAVKRMLVQFNEIATHETNLLKMSDDHVNVIRYYTQQQRAGFLYIALELCRASLADVISRPSQHRELARAGEQDLPDVLYQITCGLSHLHDLRIVHRDLKPQNILVNMGKNGRPRLLVSDFGLCKKLEGGQSSFGATTAHAAGTSGWRAPELLLDDDAPGSSMTLTDPGSSLPSGSGTGSGLPGGPGSRRVTRAIDIFSLGLVFFYVLTKGDHPFDCGDKYMREVNIRKGNYNLDALEVLGDFAYEARELIATMLSSNPRARPNVHDVMLHPFFWDAKKRLSFLCDVSDHFEKEPRDPPSEALQMLESSAPRVIKSGDFLKQLPKDFVESLGKQRKYTGGRMLDLLRALRNKRNHYEDMSDVLKKMVGSFPDGYLGFWTRRFPNLLLECWNLVYELNQDETDRFRDYYMPAKPVG
ncbi:hypothetical protein B0H66DRAFT_183516 [Apodospora peruviana]|uniref:non-specific serine/threonine protein kinase n=1 Tax=Apodospora peruviana TaxID=516989 RepID=A0AAE0IBI5_9PEZI|nr:hypothetical protein B0H66DRAFT_183516 [Apodospora peruviana]